MHEHTVAKFSPARLANDKMSGDLQCGLALQAAARAIARDLSKRMLGGAFTGKRMTGSGCREEASLTR